MTLNSSSTSQLDLGASEITTKLDTIQHLLMATCQSHAVLHQGQAVLQHGQGELLRMQNELHCGQAEVRAETLEEIRDAFNAAFNDVVDRLATKGEQQGSDRESDSDATFVGEWQGTDTGSQSSSSSCSVTISPSLPPRRRRRDLAEWSAKVAAKAKVYFRHRLSKLSSIRPRQNEQLSLWSMPFSELGLELTTVQDEEEEERRRHQARMHILHVVREANLEAASQGGHESW